jgi:hypothetical protein
MDSLPTTTLAPPLSISKNMFRGATARTYADWIGLDRSFGPFVLPRCCLHDDPRPIVFRTRNHVSTYCRWLYFWCSSHRHARCLLFDICCSVTIFLLRIRILFDYSFSSCVLAYLFRTRLTSRSCCIDNSRAKTQRPESQQ